jgi:hypothetical protein
MSTGAGSQGSHRSGPIRFIEDELSKYLQQQQQQQQPSAPSSSSSRSSSSSSSSALIVVNDPNNNHSGQVQVYNPNPGVFFPKKKQQTKKVLSEDEYVSALSKIIERDYFPDSNKLKEQLAKLDELERRQSKFGLRGLGARMTSSSSASQPAAEREDEEDTPVDIEHLTVESFFHNFTSEDNESFMELHEKDQEDHRRLYHWMYESFTGGSNDNMRLTNGPSGTESVPHAGMLMLYYVGNKVLTQSQRKQMDAILDRQTNDGDSGFDSRENMGASGTWRFQVRNNLLFEPTLDGSRYTHKLPVLDPDDESRYYLTEGDKTGPAGATEKLLLTDGSGKLRGTDNTNTRQSGGAAMLMLPPTTTVKAVLNDREKKIQRNNTSFRMMEEEETPHKAGGTGWERESPHTPSTARDTDDEDDDDWDDSTEASTPRDHAVESNTSAQSSGRKITVSKFQRKRKTAGGHNDQPLKRASDYTYVPMSPMITPDNIEMSPLMTFGHVAATPQRLSPPRGSSASGSNEKSNRNSGKQSVNRMLMTGPQDVFATPDSVLSGPRFEITGMSSREKLARNLLDAKQSKTSATASSGNGGKSNDIFSTPLSSTPLRSSTTSSSEASSKKKSMVPMSPAAAALAERLRQTKSTPNVW